MPGRSSNNSRCRSHRSTARPLWLRIRATPISTSMVTTARGRGHTRRTTSGLRCKRRCRRFTVRTPTWGIAHEPARGRGLLRNRAFALARTVRFTAWSPPHRLDFARVVPCAPGGAQDRGRIAAGGGGAATVPGPHLRHGWVGLCRHPSRVGCCLRRGQSAPRAATSADCRGTVRPC